MADYAPPLPTVDLPARMRVHALAKLLGVTSKVVVGELDRLGASVRSVQSSVDRDVAERVRTALATSSPTPVAATPDTATPDTAAPEAAAPETAVAPVEPSATRGVPLFLQPEAATVSPRRRASRAAAPPELQTAALEPEADTAAAAAPVAPSEAVDEDDDAPKRRRRGRRGRGRGRGQQGDETAEGDEDTDTAAETAAAVATTDTAAGADTNTTAETSGTETSGTDTPPTDTPPTDTPPTDTPPTETPPTETAEAEEGEHPSETTSGSRRRRRRRRKSGSGADDTAPESDTDSDADTHQNDPPNTVVHEREARSRGKSGNRTQSKDSASSDQVQGISGSTRLEAKRQRRRDGRDAGRRRPAILSESEFLARREAVNRRMVVRQRGQQTQVAILEDDVLVEHFVTSSSSTAMVGNIYLGRVQNVLPSMEAAFIDVGRGRNGVLYAGEVDWDAAGLGGKARKIEQALHSGDNVLVQVSKDPVGHKGARLTTQISLPGRFLVYVPGGGSTGISRKLPDTERKRLKEILKRIVPADAGVIIRTASEGVSEEELAHDVERLQAQWEVISTKAAEATAAKSTNPVALYEEPDLLVKVVRDQFNEDFSALVVAGDEVAETVHGYVGTVAPDLLPRVERYTGDADVFTVYRIDEQLAKAMDRKVWLPSGGTLVIDRTEAMTVVDVNTGKFTGAGGNLEETVTRNNLEAAEEIVRQMRLRDIGGMIVVDFIDMVLESNRDLVLRRLTECLGRDRTRHQVSEVTSLGLVQMTRKRMGAGLIEEFSTPCEHCHGRGVLVQDEPVTPADSDEATAHGDSGRRARRPRNDAAPKQAPVAAPVKAPWPAALIPSSSAAAHAVAPQPETPPEAEDDTPATPVPVQESPPVPAQESAPATTVRRPRARRASRPAAAPETVSEEPVILEPVIVESDAAPAPATEPVAEEAAVEEASPVVAAAPRRTRARRASRPTAAPEPVGAITVAPEPATVSAPPPAPSEQHATSAAPVATEVAMSRPRRRRAAARPAGPPVDGGPS